MIRSVRWRLTATYLILVFLAMTILGLVLSYSVERHFVSEAESALSAHGTLIGNLIAQEFDPQGKPQDLNVLLRHLAVEIQAHIVVYDNHNLLLGDSRAGSPWETVPKRAEGLRAGFGCRICHSEVKGSESLTVEVPLTRGGQRIGSIKLFASRYEAVLAAARTRRIILATLFITSLIAAAVSFRLAGSIAKPISHMSEMARKMASGDLKQRVDAKTTDEIGELASSLNALADALYSNLGQLAEEKGKMETILTTMADGIVVTDGCGVVRLFNPASERLFRMQAGVVIGNHIDGFDGLREVAQILHRALDTEAVVKQELEITVRNVRMVYAYALPLRDRSGDVTGAVAILQDVTEIRQLDRVRRDFVANASHELRTSVASIRALVEALQLGAKEEPEVLGRFLDSLDGETERLSVLLCDLLDISELEAGKKGPQRGPMRLCELAEQAVSSLADMAVQSNVTVEVSVPSDLSASVDKRHIQRALVNLLDNAIKYTPAGGRVEISGHETETEVSITVSDTGVGIPLTEIDRIFERFYRVDKARSRRLGGTGLGLSIVKDVAEAHGGTVSVESEVGKGSAFTFTVSKV